MQGLKRPRKRRTNEFEYEEKILLIKHVQARKILWDMNDKKHFDAVHLKRAWESVAADLNKDITSCKTAWKSLRDSHRYFCKTRQQKGEKREAGEWRLAPHMSFLPKEFRERGPNKSSFTPDDREDSEYVPEMDDFDCDETASLLETDNSSLVDEVKDLDKDLSNWTEDLYSSVGKIRERKDKSSPTKAEESIQQLITTSSRPIFAYWESILNKMSPEDADAAEQQMTQALWAENASIKYKKSH